MNKRGVLLERVFMKRFANAFSLSKAQVETSLRGDEIKRWFDTRRRLLGRGSGSPHLANIPLINIYLFSFLLLLSLPRLLSTM